MIPFDRPLIQIQQYAVGVLPRPTLSLPPVLNAEVDEAVAAVINHCTGTVSRGAIRMFCLNTIVYNNFQNQSFPRIVELSIRRAADLAIRNNNPLNVRFYLVSAVSDVLQLFLSSLVVNTPQLFQTLSPSDQQAAHSNYQQFSAFEGALANLNLGVYMAPPAAQVAAPLYNNYTPHFHGATNQAPINQNPGASSIGSQWDAQPAVVTQPQQNVNSLQQNSYFTTAEVKLPSPPPPQQVVHTAEPEFFSTAVTTHQPTQSSVTPQPEVKQQPAVTSDTFYPTTSLTCQGQTEMDINVHAIPYFGSGLNVDLSSRRMDFKSDVLALNRASLESAKTGPVLLNTNFQVEIGLEDAMLEASKILNSNRTAESAPTVYRFFCAVLNPRVVTNGVERVQSSIQEAEYLGDVVTAIRAGYKSLFKDPSNPSLIEQNFLNSLSFLDRRITVLVNNFLQYNMRVNTRIESFSEDYIDLCATIQNKFGTVYTDIFSSWCAKLHSSIRTFMKNHEKNARNVVEGYLDEEGISFVYIPSFESVTFVSMTAKELSYSVTLPVGHQIDSRSTPVLNDLVETLNKNKKDRNMFTTRDWLVTADDHRYILASSAIEPSSWFIYPFNN